MLAVKLPNSLHIGTSQLLLCLASCLVALLNPVSSCSDPANAKYALLAALHGKSAGCTTTEPVV
jgi:hypothetical protein